jgi:hypothetical protein
MKRRIYLILALAGIVCCAGKFSKIAAQAPSHETRHVFTPDTIPWGPPPPVVRPGAQFAVLEGNPLAASGDYTVRLKMPDGYRISPHWHPKRENVTVNSRTFKVGMGDVFNTKTMVALTGGSFGFLDPSMHHYAMACGKTIVQVHGQALRSLPSRTAQRRAGRLG